MQKRSKTKLELMLAGAFPAAQLIAAWGTIENVETFVKAMFGFLAPGHVMVFMDYVSLAFFVGMMWAVPQLFLNGLTRWRRSSRRRKAQVKKHGGLGPGWFPIAKVVSVSEDYGPERDKELKAARDRIAMLETDREVARGREEVAQSRNKLLEDQLKATHRARDNEAQKTLDAEMNRAAKTMLGRGVTGPITKQQMMEGTAAAAGVKTPEGNHAVLDATGVRKGKAAFHECVDRYLAAASEHMERDEHERVPFSEWRAGLMEEAAKYVDASGRALIEKGIVHAWSSSTDDSDRYYYVINNLLGTVADIQDKHFHA